MAPDVAWRFCLRGQWQFPTCKRHHSDRVMKSPIASNHLCSRASFLARTGVALLATMAGANAVADATSPSLRAAKGKANSKVKRWDIITIGNLSRNRYWGEPNDQAVRKVLCT